MAKKRKSARFVSRGGDKLDGALTDFGVDVKGCVAADLGANVGGFTDCLLQRGASRVYAVDTGYGVLEWKLRQDDRVVVLERQNALHLTLPEPVDLAVVDMGWTPLSLAAPSALGLVGDAGYVVALLKPQYESADYERQKGVVLPECMDGVIDRTVIQLENQGICVVRQTPSRVPGSGGNREVFLLLRRE